MLGSRPAVAWLKEVSALFISEGRRRPASRDHSKFTVYPSTFSAMFNLMISLD